MRRDECVPFDSIWKPSIGKDCSILFPTETTEYFIGAIVQKSKWNSDFPVIAVKTRKECYFRSYSKFSKRFPLKKARSIWFPTRKVVVKAPSISTPDYWAEQIIHADICTLRNKFLWKKCWISNFMYGKHLPYFLPSGEIEECENVKSILGKLARSSFAASFGVNDDLSAALAVTAILELALIIVTLIVKVFTGNLIFLARGYKHVIWIVMERFSVCFSLSHSFICLKRLQVATPMYTTRCKI